MINIIVVEDYDIIREDICERLNKVDEFNVVASCSNSRDAIELYKLHRPDILLLDIELEEVNSGIKVCEEILSFDEGAKVIYLTSHDEDSMVASALATRAVDFITKDSPLERLITHINGAYNGEHLLESRFQRIAMGEYRRIKTSEKRLYEFITILPQLTQAERELISLLLDGYKLSEISKMRYVEQSTIKSQIRTLLHKFSFSRSKEIVKMIKGLNLEHLFKKDIK